ncbi:MAG: DUF3768 domain-containing protein [Candidatus Saccharimonadales bacterium]
MDTEQAQNKISARIANRNDEFRRARTASYIVTQGVIMRVDLSRAIDTVRCFDSFNEDNDPYGEHDFGRVELDGEVLFWKIDYFNEGLSGWCDPLNLNCRRVLTVMLAEEY